MTRETTATIATWSRLTFGDVPLRLVAARANQEMAELLVEVNGQKRKEKLAEECADIVIVLCRIANSFGYDLWSQVEAKMTTNRRREWHIDPHTHLGQHK